MLLFQMRGFAIKPKTSSPPRSRNVGCGGLEDYSCCKILQPTQKICCANSSYIYILKKTGKLYADDAMRTQGPTELGIVRTRVL